MHVFLDTNVLLDVYLRRAGEIDSSRVMLACGSPWNDEIVVIHSLSNAFYLISRQHTRQMTREFVHDILAWVKVVAGVSSSDVQRTERMGMNVFEDALQIAAAEGCSADVIVTRNIKDFAGKTNIPLLLPENFVDQPPAGAAGNAQP